MHSCILNIVNLASNLTLLSSPEDAVRCRERGREERERDREFNRNSSICPLNLSQARQQTLNSRVHRERARVLARAFIGNITYMTGVPRLGFREGGPGGDGGGSLVRIVHRLNQQQTKKKLNTTSAF